MNPIVSYRIGVEDVGFRLYILFLITTKALYCISYLLLLLRFPVPAISVSHSYNKHDKHLDYANIYQC